MSLLDKASLILVPGAPQKASEIWAAKPVTQSIGVTRGTTKFRTNASGLLQSVAANVAALDYRYAGVLQSCPAWLVEPAATNSALHSRDLTNAVWVRTNMNATRDQVGADGSANTATRLTATAANATILQSLTLASAQRTWSAWIRRLTGTGRIEMTMDGGASWVIVTSGITSTFAPISIPAQTLSNNSVGFRIADSGDEIVVDFVQLEAGLARTSPIITGASIATRNADVISLTGASGLIGQTEGTIYVDENFLQNAINKTGLDDVLIGFSDGTLNNFIAIIHYGNGSVGSFNSRIRAFVRAGGTNQVQIDSPPQSAGRFKIAFGYSENDFVLYVNGQQIGVDTSGSVPSTNRVFLYDFLTSQAPNQPQSINAAVVYLTRLSNAQLAEITTL